MEGLEKEIGKSYQEGVEQKGQPVEAPKLPDSMPRSLLHRKWLRNNGGYPRIERKN